MDKLPDAIRRAAEKQGLTMEALRKKTKIANGPFYELLNDKVPSKISTSRKYREGLEAAGVRVPKDALAA